MSKKLLSGVAAVALAAGVVTFAAGGAGASTQGGQESFTLVSTNDSPTGTIVAHGAFADGGVDITKNGRDRVRMSQGAFTIYHPDDDATYRFHFNPATCAFTVKGTGSFSLGQGTRAYRGISGTGTYRLEQQGVATRGADGQCDPEGASTTSTEVIHAHASVSFGDES